MPPSPPVAPEAAPARPAWVMPVRKRGRNAEVLDLPEGVVTQAEFSRRIDVNQGSVHHWIARGVLDGEALVRVWPRVFVRVEAAERQLAEWRARRDDGLVTSKRFAELVGVTPPRVSRWIARGTLDGEAVTGRGRGLRIRVEEATRQLRERLVVRPGHPALALEEIEAAARLAEGTPDGALLGEIAAMRRALAVPVVDGAAAGGGEAEDLRPRTRGVPPPTAGMLVDVALGARQRPGACAGAAFVTAVIAAAGETLAVTGAARADLEAFLLVRLTPLGLAGVAARLGRDRETATAGWRRAVQQLAADDDAVTAAVMIACRRLARAIGGG